MWLASTAQLQFLPCAIIAKKKESLKAQGDTNMQSGLYQGKPHLPHTEKISSV